MKERKIFRKSGMQLDKDARDFQPNDYGYALNCLSGNSNSNNEGCIENRKGNTLINFVLPDGINKVVGATKDINRNAIVYMVYNSNQNHCILRYNIGSQTIDKIVYGEKYLNFQPERIISSINIIGDLLYWTDGYFDKFTYDPAVGEFKDQYFNPPRKINMVKAYNLTNNVNVAPLYKYSTIDEQVLDRIKYPPVNKPIASYGTDINKRFNFIIGSLFQFATANIYDDKEKSVLSPISDVPIPLGQELVNGQYSTLQPTQNNTIGIKINTGTETVTQINLYVRKLNTGDWYLLDTIDKYDNEGNQIISNNIVYDYSMANGLGFYNNEILTPVDQIDLSRPFDYVGQIVDNQTLLNDDRIIDGGITENYDNTDIDVLLTRETSLIDFANATIQVQSSFIGFHEGGALIEQVWVYTVQQEHLITLPAASSPGALYEIKVTWQYVESGTNQTQLLTYSTVLLPSDVYPTTIRDRLVDIFNDNQSDYNVPPPQGQHAVASGTDAIRLYIVYVPGAGINPNQVQTITVVLNIINNSGLINGFKKGFNHNLGIRYTDRARRSGAINKSPDTSIYMPYDTETMLNNGYFHDRNVHHINWNIKHQPPEWATHYQWYYAHQTPKFFQFYYKSGQTQLLSNGNIEIDINTNILLLQYNRPKTVLKTYTFTKGDRIRFLATGQFAVPNNWWNHPEFLDTEIVSYDTTTGKIAIEDIGYVTKRIEVPSGWDYNIYEIYTPRKISDESIYYAIGDIFEIGNPHTSQRYHKGETQDQDPNNLSVVPAMGKIYNGDIYVKARYCVEPPIIPAESDLLSDYYDSNAISIGSASIVVPDMKRQKYTNLRYSNQYLEDTRINNLSRFDFLNQKNVSNEFGDITALNQIGYTLKVLQKNKNTSFDVGIQQLTGGGGDNISVVSSTEILGSPRPSVLGFGCQNPESVCVNDRYQYWWDQNYGAFLRDSANGMTVISDLGVKSFFARKKQECNSAVSYKVLTSFNKKNDEVIVCFITKNVIVDPRDSSVSRDVFLSETIVFNEQDEVTKWTTFLSYDKLGVPIDYLTALGDTLVTFLNGQLYLEDDNVLFGNMFGEQKKMIIDVVGNADGEKIKVIDAIALTTNLNKYIPNSLSNWRCDSVIVPPTSVNPTGGYTIIPANRFKMKEESLYSEVPRNINTLMSGSQQFKMLNGNPMRGQCVTFRLVNESSDSVVLYSVVIKSTASELSK